MKKTIAIVAALAGSVFFSVAYAGDTNKTCGQMISEQAGMPGKLAELMTAYADESDAHAAFMAASKDKNAAAEADAMKKLFADAKVKAAMDKEAALQKEIGEMIAKMAPAPKADAPAAKK